MNVDLGQERTLATVTLLGIGLVILLVASRPLRVWKLGLVAAMAGGYVVVFLVAPLREFFQLESLSAELWSIAAIASTTASIVIAMIAFVCNKIGSRRS